MSYLTFLATPMRQRNSQSGDDNMYLHIYCLYKLLCVWQEISYHFDIRRVIRDARIKKV